MKSMEKKATFDAIVNANKAITIPEATRTRLGIERGSNLKVTIKIENPGEGGE